MGGRSDVVTDVHVVYPLGRTDVCIRERLMSRVTCHNQPLWLNVRLSLFKSVKVRFSPLKARECNRQNRLKQTRTDKTDSHVSRVTSPLVRRMAE